MTLYMMGSVVSNMIFGFSQQDELYIIKVGDSLFSENQYSFMAYQEGKLYTTQWPSVTAQTGGLSCFWRETVHETRDCLTSQTTYPHKSQRTTVGYCGNNCHHIRAEPSRSRIDCKSFRSDFFGIVYWVWKSLIVIKRIDPFSVTSTTQASLVYTVP